MNAYAGFQVVVVSIVELHNGCGSGVQLPSQNLQHFRPALLVSGGSIDRIEKYGVATHRAHTGHLMQNRNRMGEAPNKIASRRYPVNFLEDRPKIFGSACVS